MPTTSACTIVVILCHLFDASGNVFQSLMINLRATFGIEARNKRYKLIYSVNISKVIQENCNAKLFLIRFI